MKYALTLISYKNKSYILIGRAYVDSYILFLPLSHSSPVSLALVCRAEDVKRLINQLIRLIKQ